MYDCHYHCDSFEYTLAMERICEEKVMNNV